MNSTILSDNERHYENLQRYLESGVGKHSRWLLCYRASLHGWLASTFHANCDGKDNTVTIIRKGTNIFGGYTDIPWSKSIV